MYQVFDEEFVKIVSGLFQDIGTKVAFEARSLLLAGNYRDLFSLKVSPHDYSSPSRYLLDASACELLRKLDVDVGVDREAAAIATFWECERQNARTNARLDRLLNNHIVDEHDQALFESLERARLFIKNVLGPIPKDLNPRFGPGVTFCRRGKQSLLPDKMAFSPSITQRARVLLPLWEDTAWARALVEDRPYCSEPHVVRGNRFTTVPKDNKKFRGICIEPSINVAYQLAVGSHIRGRLKRSGIDLKSGQDVHRRVACESSRTQYFATIDLSNASDTIAYNLVKALLPGDWFELLDDLRSPFTSVDGKWVHLQKFSSMGNGYTFELESLIFLALCQEASWLSDVDAVPGENLFVYGDDMIVHHSIAHTCLLLLSECGLTPNSEKTFTSGPFRESCGGDFFDGRAVRPYYLKGLPNEPAKWISMANGLRRLAGQISGLPFDCSPFSRTWFRILDQLPSDIRRCRGPVSLGDLVIHDDARFWTVRSRDGMYECAAYVPVSERIAWDHWTSAVVMACALYGIDSGSNEHDRFGGYAPREGFFTKSYRRTWTSCLEYSPGV